MSEKEPELSSDESDDDYVPEGENGVASEEDDSGDAESGPEDVDGPKCKRRRKIDTEDDFKKDTPKPELDKNTIDALYEDFKREEPKAVSNQTDSKPPSTSINTTTEVKKRPNILNASVKRSGGGGISSLLSQLGQKNKLSTLEKSKLDWNNFKRAEGIEEDLTSHNRGRDGFLERRDFLERTDLRQFEIEKELRTTKRSNR